MLSLFSRTTTPIEFQWGGRYVESSVGTIEHAAMLANNNIKVEVPVALSTWQRNRPVLWVYAAAAGLAAVVGASLVVSSFSQQQAQAARDCITIRADSARLACYDRVLHHTPAEPARGAGAPATALGE